MREWFTRPRFSYAWLCLYMVCLGIWRAILEAWGWWIF